jgi:beta-N-acetylhexosaminidase
MVTAWLVVTITYLAQAPATVAATPAQAQSTIEDRVARMTLRAKVGQLVMFSINGTTLSSTERDVIRGARLSNVILFAKNYSNRTQLENLTDQIQRAANAGRSEPIGALISVDQEGGVVKRFPDMAPWHSAPELGDADPSLSFEEGQATGRALRRAGVNVDLAPVADLDLPPEHVMRSRSFGSAPRKVGRRVTKFARGLQSERTVATAKHFPGLGGATMNTDYGRAYVNRSRWQLHHVDALPFHRMIDGGLRMVMVSHAIYPQDGGKRPASVNHYIATDRLRDEFDFTGVAISDALEMVAWHFDGNVARTCRATVWAGIDVALITGDVQVARACAASIRAGVDSGSISEARLDRSVARVLRLKEWVGVFSP